MDLGALLEGKLGESEGEEEEHEESDSSAFDKFYDALKWDDREAAKDALNHVVYEHMMEMDDEEEAEDEKGGVLIAMSPKKGGEMNSDRELKQANSRIRELSGSPVSRSEAESNYKKLSGEMSRKSAGAQMTRRERERDRDAAEARPWKLPSRPRARFVTAKKKK